MGCATAERLQHGVVQSANRDLRHPVNAIRDGSGVGAPGRWGGVRADPAIHPPPMRSSSASPPPSGRTGYERRVRAWWGIETITILPVGSSQ